MWRSCWMIIIIMSSTNAMDCNHEDHDHGQNNDCGHFDHCNPDDYNDNFFENVSKKTIKAKFQKRVRLSEWKWKLAIFVVIVVAIFVAFLACEWQYLSAASFTAAGNICQSNGQAPCLSRFFRQRSPQNPYPSYMMMMALVWITFGHRGWAIWAWLLMMVVMAPGA